MKVISVKFRKNLFIFCCIFESIFFLFCSGQRLEKPVIAPLQKLAFASCRLSSVPDLGILPDLVMLNVSFNPLDQITPQQLSQYCSLKIVAVESPTEMSPCMCQTLRSYFERRAIQLKDWYDCPTIHEGKFIEIFAKQLNLLEYISDSF